MTDIPKVKYTDLASLLNSAATASELITTEIASHAERAHAKREKRLEELKASHRMTEHRTINVT